MSYQYGGHAIWCQKMGETTEVIVVEQDTSWKIWTTVTKQPEFEHTGDQELFIVKQHTGPKKCATFEFNTKTGSPGGATCHFSSFSPAEQYDITLFPRLDDQLLISVGIVISEPFRAKPIEKLTVKDYLITVGDKEFAVDRSITKKLKQFAKDEKRRKVELHGVEYEDIMMMINPENIDSDITVEQCRRFAEIERKYGIKYQSEKVDKLVDTNFLINADRLNTKMMSYRTTPIVTPIDMRISKKIRVLNLPIKIRINAFDMDLDIYFYIQEYNRISCLSVGVISDKSTDNEYWSSLISINIQLHHPQNPEFNRSADISREFNNYQRSAGCPTFMLSSEMGDYCQRDGSFVITISISPSIITNDLQYPGINDTVLCSGNKRINVSRDLLLHYCDYFKTLPNTDKLSADIFTIESLIMLLDIIYHRSTGLTKASIKKLLNISETIVCPYAHNYCDRLLASFYHTKLLSIKQTKEFLDGYDLPELREAEQTIEYVEPAPPVPPAPGGHPLMRAMRKCDYPSKVHTSTLPSDARIVTILTIKDLVSIILPLKLFKSKKEQLKLCEQFDTPNGALKLKPYRMAISTLEGVPYQLRMDLQASYNALMADQRGSSGLITRLIKFKILIGDGGFEALKEKAEAETALVQSAIAELQQLIRGEWLQVDRPSIGAILARSEEDCRKGRMEAARMFVDRLRMELVAKKKKEKEKEESFKVQYEMKCWVEYFGPSDRPSFNL